MWDDDDGSSIAACLELPCLPTTHPWCFVVEFLARFFLEEGQRKWVRRTMSQKADLLLDKEGLHGLHSARYTCIRLS